MVEKVEGAEWNCGTCNTHLVCRMKVYEGDFKDKLQWQNPDGSAHFAYNGHEYSCNIPPDTDTSSTPDPNPIPPSETPKDDSDVQCKDVIDEMPKEMSKDAIITLDKISCKWIDKEDTMIDQIVKHLIKKHTSWTNQQVIQRAEVLYLGMLLK